MAASLSAHVRAVESLCHNAYRRMRPDCYLAVLSRVRRAIAASAFAARRRPRSIALVVTPQKNPTVKYARARRFLRREMADPTYPHAEESAATTRSNAMSCVGPIAHMSHPPGHRLQGPRADQTIGCPNGNCQKVFRDQNEREALAQGWA